MPKGTSTSVDAYLIQATCAIVQRNKDNNIKVVATAWLASSEGHLVTAGHTFSEKQNAGTTIEVQFLNKTPEPAVIIEVMHNQSKGLDFAILKLSTPPKQREPLKFMLVNEASGEFLLRGYGSSLPHSQSPGKGEFIGLNIRAGDSEHILFQLRSPELAFEGFSGGAVYSTQLEAVIAIQIEAKKGSDTVLAMPLYRIPEYWAEIANLASLPGTCFVVAPKERVSRLVDEIVRPVIVE
ncbi:MAG: trypsin-like peptidase domain-containing protein, partial [Anaerolineae bacterium]|nr:trypsin-like peptidase domain-containing protein [Anaerolineae bacterium]